MNLENSKFNCLENSLLSLSLHNNDDDEKTRGDRETTKSDIILKEGTKKVGRGLLASPLDSHSEHNARSHFQNHACNDNEDHPPIITTTKPKMMNHQQQQLGIRRPSTSAFRKRRLFMRSHSLDASVPMLPSTRRGSTGSTCSPPLEIDFATTSNHSINNSLGGSTMHSIYSVDEHCSINDNDTSNSTTASGFSYMSSAIPKDSIALQRSRLQPLASCSEHDVMNNDGCDFYSDDLSFISSAIPKDSMIGYSHRRGGSGFGLASCSEHSVMTTAYPDLNNEIMKDSIALQRQRLTSIENFNCPEDDSNSEFANCCYDDLSYMSSAIPKDSIALQRNRHYYNSSTNNDISSEVSDHCDNYNYNYNDDIADIEFVISNANPRDSMDMQRRFFLASRAPPASSSYSSRDNAAAAATDADYADINDAIPKDSIAFHRRTTTRRYNNNNAYMDASDHYTSNDDCISETNDILSKAIPKDSICGDRRFCFAYRQQRTPRSRQHRSKPRLGQHERDAADRLDLEDAIPKDSMALHHRSYCWESPQLGLKEKDEDFSNNYLEEEEEEETDHDVDLYNSKIYTRGEQLTQSYILSNAIPKDSIGLNRRFFFPSKTSEQYNSYDDELKETATTGSQTKNGKNKTDLPAFATTADAASPTTTTDTTNDKDSTPLQPQRQVSQRTFTMSSSIHRSIRPKIRNKTNSSSNNNNHHRRRTTRYIFDCNDAIPKDSIAIQRCRRYNNNNNNFNISTSSAAGSTSIDLSDHYSVASFI